MSLKKVVIYYFSGTGNTKVVTEMLCEQMNKNEAYEVVFISIEEALRDVEKLPSDEIYLLGIAFPIYGLGMPRIVSEFVKLLEYRQNQKVFILMTAADFIGVNQNATEHLKRLLGTKGYRVFYERIIPMGANWMVQYDETLEKQLYSVAKEKAKHMSKELMAEVPRIYKPNFMIRGLSRVTHYFEENYGARYFGKSLYANEKCISCGLCINNCPMKNIAKNTHADGKSIHFSDNCVMCMRCVYACPVEAIKSKYMGFVILKKGYNIQKVINNDVLKEDFINPKTKGFYKHFITYVEDESI